MSLAKHMEQRIWSILIYLPVGLVTLGYILYKRDFAKIHLDINGLPFPVFVGEILLLFCFILFCLRSIKHFKQPEPVYFGVMLFFLWFILKVYAGYCQWGPLAFRHAALYYYSFFFLVAYVFFNKNLFSDFVKCLILMCIMYIFLFMNYDRYWTFTLGALSSILVIKMERKYLKIIAALLLACSFPYEKIYNTSRMMLLANIFTIIFLMVGSIYVIKMKRKFKWMVVAVVLLGIIFGFYKALIKGESGRVFVTPAQVMDAFKNMDDDMKKRQKNFAMQPLRVGLFHPENDQSKQVKYSYANKEYYDSVHQEKPPPGYQPPSDADKPDNDVKKNMMWESVNNIIFRLFIWRDLFNDWMATKPFFGFDFGKPFRSISLETLKWAELEWKRDGWIEPHNSFFHILYRAGIVGIFLVGLIWFGLLRVIRKAFKERLMVLLILTAILVNWLIAANFLLILEVPYTAIPLWFMAGMTWAYAYGNDCQSVPV